ALGIQSRLTVPSLPPRRSLSSAPASVELRDAAGADVSGVRERADLASVVIAENASEPFDIQDRVALAGLPEPGPTYSAPRADARSSSLPVTMLAQRHQLGLRGLQWQRQRWLYAGIGVGVLLLAMVIMTLSLGGEDDSLAPAAQPPDHVAEFQPPPVPRASGAPTIEVTPAEAPSLDIVRPEELEV